MLASNQQRMRAHISPVLINTCLFYFSRASGCEMVSHCGFDLHFPNVKMKMPSKRLFMCSLAICMSSLEKCLFKSIAHLKTWVICLFVFEFQEFITYSKYKYTTFRYFSHYMGCAFTFFVMSLEIEKFLIFISSPVYFFFSCLYFWCGTTIVYRTHLAFQSMYDVFGIHQLTKQTFENWPGNPTDTYNLYGKIYLQGQQ